jgi:CDP-diacylglycerol--glycerol-3-phosphate 3-phosphatidyltransferase
MSVTETLRFLKGSILIPRQEPLRLKGTIWQHSRIANFYYFLLLHFAKWTAKARISPDSLTVGSLAVSVVATFAIAYGQFGYAAVFLVISGSLDLLDGAVARLTNQASRWGALLDSTVDRVADALPLCGLLFFYASNRIAMSIIVSNILFGFTISYVRARSESLGKKLPETFMRRAERLIVLFSSLLLGLVETPPIDTLFGITHAPLMVAILIGTVLNLIGVSNILVVAYRHLSPVQSERIESTRTRVN